MAKGRALNDADIPSNIKRVLVELADRLRRELGDVEVYLFGSYARGDWLKSSDLDLIVVSPKFEGMSIGERYRIVRSLLPDTISVELLLYTPREFARARERSVVVRDASRYWIKL